MALNHKIRCCKKCGHIEMWQKELYPVCQYCNYELTDTEYILQDVLERGGIKPEIRKAILPAFCTVVILERFVDWQMGHLGVFLGV